MPIYLAVENYSKRTKRQQSKKRMKLKEDIIVLYNEARGVLPTENWSLLFQSVIFSMVGYNNAEVEVQE